MRKIPTSISFASPKQNHLLAALSALDYARLLPDRYDLPFD
jgi:hypothetical protein